MKVIIKNHCAVSVKELAIPQITRDSEVILKIAYVGICRTDLYVAKNLLGKTNPIILGHEASGSIIEVGKNVRDFKVGDAVAINPLRECANCCNCHNRLPCYDLKMIGVDFDGALAEYICIEEKYLYKINNELSLLEAAYIEPVAASLSVLNSSINNKQLGAIFGNNRIAELTKRILKSQGFQKIELLNPSNSEAKYDFIIETLATNDSFAEITNYLKHHGTLVIKSRQALPVEIDCNKIIKKELKLEAVNYGSFSVALELLESKVLNIHDLIGEIYEMGDFQQAFISAENSETNKVFIKVS